jgi:sulfite reductase alpha subunit-like flavoprotein
MTQVNFHFFNQLELKIPFESTLDSPLTIEKVFTEYFNVNHSPKPSFLNSLTKFSNSPSEIEKLKKLSEYNESNQFSKEITQKMINIVDLLEMYPSVKIPFENIIEMLPRMYPRYYSISSSNLVNPEKIAITVAELRRNQFSGLCSSYLNNIKQGSNIRGFIRTSEFRLPKDSQTPLIFIAGGTGCAPFIGFIEERRFLKSQGIPLGPVIFFYGCRDFNSVLYHDFIVNAHRDGIISDLYIVFSDIENTFGPPMFVSEKMKIESEKLWKCIQNDATIYICG